MSLAVQKRSNSVATGYHVNTMLLMYKICFNEGAYQCAVKGIVFVKSIITAGEIFYIISKTSAANVILPTVYNFYLYSTKHKYALTDS